MDKEGYKTYLQSMPNKNNYIADIPMLIQLEKELNINLDDYIPYNNDYSKNSALDAILPKSKQYDERLQFSINSYVRYRLSGLDKAKCLIADKDFTCNEFFTFKGTEEELEKELSAFIVEKDIKSFIEGIKKYELFYDNDEFIEITSFVEKKSETDSNMINLLLEKSDYNINLRALTITILALLLDIKLTIGFASTTLAILGFNNQAIVKIEASEGEKCLILEAIRSKNKIINEHVFVNCNHQCVNNNIACKFRNSDNCNISKEEIKEILDKLCEKNIFKKIGNYYKYNF